MIIAVSLVVTVIIVIATNIVTTSSPLFTCVTCCFCILRKVGLEWRCSHRVFYTCAVRAGSDVTDPSQLRYWDVFVLTPDYFDFQDKVIDDAGQVTSPANGIVRGLRAEGVPVYVLEGIDRVGGGVSGGVSGGTRVGSQVSDVAAVGRAGWESRVGEVVLSLTDRVTVAACRCVRGLERRVVVWVADWRRDLRGSDLYHGLVGMSRCTTQLVIVYTP